MQVRQANLIRQPESGGLTPLATTACLLRSGGRLDGVALATLILLVSLLACTDPIECGPGQMLVGDDCLPACGDGAELDAERGVCVAVCIDGTYRDEETGGCLPDGAQCTSGWVFSVDLDECVEISSICAPRTTWLASEQRCIPNEDLLEADFVESGEENDPMWGGPSAFEAVELPEEGETVVLYGTVDAPRDRNGNGLMNPDFDFWVFSVDEPTVLRVSADGVGGASSGFQLVGLQAEPYVRFGFGTTSTDVIRDVFLPEAGAYALIASDALNFLVRGAGPYHGGGDMAYYIGLTPLPMPEPQGLSFAGDVAAGEAPLPLEAPSDGSMLGFFSIDIDGRSTYLLEIEGQGAGPLGPELVVVPEVEAAAWNPRPFIKGFVHDQRVLLVADHVNYFGIADGHLRVRVSRSDSTWIDGLLEPTVFEQEGWSHGRRVPWQLLGFEADRGDVVTARFTSGTGRTCVQALDRRFRWLLDTVGCDISLHAQPIINGELRFVAFESGYHGMRTVDWDGTSFSGGNLSSVPDHDFELGVSILRQRPFHVASLPWSTSVETDGETTERFGTIRLGARQAIGGEIRGESAPWVRFYEQGAGQLRAAGPAQEKAFVWRSIEEEIVLFGAGGANESAAEHGLQIGAVTFPTIGAVPAAGELETTEYLEAGQSRWIFHLEHTAPGMVELQLSVSGDTDLVARPLDGNLTPRLANPVPLTELPGTELRAPISDDGLFVEIMTADGSQAETDLSLFLRANLDPARQEGSGNTHYIWSQRLHPPSTVAGSIRHREEVGWYRVNLEQPTMLEIETLPRGSDAIGSTEIILADQGGEPITRNTGGGVGRHGLVQHLLFSPGIYTFAVLGGGEETGGYLLSVTATDP